MIKIKELRYAYKQSPFVLRIPELNVEPGEQVAIVGPSGSGKTTLLNLIAGILVPDHGTVSLEEKAISSLSDTDRRQLRLCEIGLVFQEFELLEYLSVRDNILLPYRLTSKLKLDHQVEERLGRFVQALGIEEKLNRPIRRLSQGERQRVAICRALLPEPSLVLADEPTGNLDPVNKQKIVDLLVEQTRQANASLIAVTHDHSLLDNFDRTIDLASASKNEG